MNIRATFPAGVNAITVNGLHQWDYGRQLEIQADDLPAMVEVHFACAGMAEAVVRSCDASSGTAVASIPDICLEQSGPVTAWVYAIGETSGTTILTVTLPLIARARPAPGETVPQQISDKYTEAVAAMNALVGTVDEELSNVAAAVRAEIIEDLQDGDVSVPKADEAESATCLQDGDATFGRKLLLGLAVQGRDIASSPLTFSLGDADTQAYPFLVIEYSYTPALDLSGAYNRAAIIARTLPTGLPHPGGSDKNAYVDIPIYHYDGATEYIKLSRTDAGAFTFSYKGTLKPLSVEIRRVYLEY